MIQKAQPIQFGLSPNGAAFSLVSAESQFALEEFHATQFFFPITYSDVFIFLKKELFLRGSVQNQHFSLLYQVFRGINWSFTKFNRS